MREKMRLVLFGLALLLAGCSSDEGLCPLGKPDFSGSTPYSASDFVVTDSVTYAYRDVINARIQKLAEADDGANSADADDEMAQLMAERHRVDSLERAFADSLADVYGSNSDDNVSLGVILKKVNYKSKSADGNDVVLSALIGYSGMTFNIFGYKKFVYYKPNTLLIGCHATITSNDQCPTQLLKLGFWDFIYTDVGQMVVDARPTYLSGFESLVVIPDYQGWGDTSDQNHPYLMQEATARQVVDAATQTLDWFTANCSSMEDDWHTGIVGFSQGGSTAMATMKHIEQTEGLSSKLKLGGAVCGNGPYDPVATFKHYVEEGKVNMPEALVLIVMGAVDYDQDLKNYKMEDFFTEKFLNTGIVQAIRDKNRTSAGLEDLIKEKGVTCFEGNYWHLTDIMPQDIIDYFSGKEVAAPYKAKCEALYNALSRNNLAGMGWKPKNHLILYHTKDDPTVPIANYWSAVRVMNNGNLMGIRDNEPDVRGASHTDVGTTFYTSWDKDLLRTVMEEDRWKDSEWWRAGLWYTDKYTQNRMSYSEDTIPE